LRDGEGVPKDLAGAVKYFKLAVDQGDSYAQNKYALALHDGDGVPKDLAGAAKYFKLAADQGSSCAQFNYALDLT
jgi:TPR repeat protein